MQIFNLAKITKIEYADILNSATTVPTTLTEVTASRFKEGTVSVNIAEDTVTVDRAEDHLGYHARISAKGDITAGASFSEIDMDVLGDLSGGTYAAGTAGTTPETVSFKGNEENTPKYVKLTGLNTDGNVSTMEFFRCLPTWSYSGNVGPTQETQGVMISFHPIYHRGLTKTMTIGVLEPGA